MPTDLDNAKLMFLCLQYSTATTFDYKKIGEQCGVSAGAASKRMSRLKQAVSQGKENGLDVRYLWSCIQNSDMNNVDFKAVGEELNLNSGTASKRWSRLKQALERGETGSTGGGVAAGAKQGSSKKAATTGKKRQNTEPADGHETDTGTVKKARRIFVEDEEGLSTADQDNKEDPMDEDAADAAISDNLNTPGDNPAPARAITKAATTVPKKQKQQQQPTPDNTAAVPAAAASASTTTLTNSAPPVLIPATRRRRKPLTDEELYRKLDVDAAEQHEKSQLSSSSTSRLAYPTHYNLTQTFQALRTPAASASAAEPKRKRESLETQLKAIVDAYDASADDEDDSNGGGTAASTPRNPVWSSSLLSFPPVAGGNGETEGPSPMRTADEVFSAIAEDVRSHPLEDTDWGVKKRGSTGSTKQQQQRRKKKTAAAAATTTTENGGGYTAAGGGSIRNNDDNNIAAAAATAEHDDAGHGGALDVTDWWNSDVTGAAAASTTQTPFFDAAMPPLDVTAADGPADVVAVDDAGASQVNYSSYFDSDAGDGVGEEEYV